MRTRVISRFMSNSNYVDSELPLDPLYTEKRTQETPPRVLHMISNYDGFPVVENGILFIRDGTNIPLAIFNAGEWISVDVEKEDSDER